VAIARAIVNEPKLLLADEPTGNLDSTNVANVADLLFQLREKTGMTFILVTHDDALAARCPRMASSANRCQCGRSRLRTTQGSQHFGSGA
jgi:putative ABC transport system ATP-binding protein